MFSSPGEIMVVTNPDQEFIARDQAGMIGCGCRILSEPEGKNTLPAVYYGMREIEQSSGAAKVAVLPSDHMVHAGPVYADAFRKAEELADTWLVLFGVKATGPHTGFGYIRPGPDLGGAYAVDSFAEKPDQPTAERYLRDGYLWNSGMFLFSTRLFFDECGVHSPDVVRSFTKAIPDAYKAVPSVSIDYGLMEKTSRAAVVPLDAGWNDLGSFDSFYSYFPKNGDTNAVRGEYIGLDSTGNLVMGDHLVVTIGVHDTAIIDSGDVTLIAPRHRAEEAKQAVALLKQKGDPRADSHLTEYRPWGSYTRLEDGPSYRIKRITVPSGRCTGWRIPALSPWRSSKSRSGSTSGRTISSGCRTIITALRNEEKAEYRGTVRF